jgi:hypothetical protein
MQEVLDIFEDSREGYVPALQQISDDPFADTLSRLEASIENAVIPATLYHNPLDEILSQLEEKTEGQILRLPASEEATFFEEQQPVRIGIGPTSEPPLLPTDATRYMEFSQLQPCRMHGSKTGIRCNGGEMIYCNLQDRHINVDDCDNCPDFEPTVLETGDYESYVCRHLYYDD